MTEESTLKILLGGIHILSCSQPDLINDLNKLMFADIALNSLGKCLLKVSNLFL